MVGPRSNSGGASFNWFTLDNLALNGVGVTPNEPLAGNAPPDPRNFSTFFISGFAPAVSYELTGIINYNGPLGLNGAAEAARVDIAFGTVQPIPLPAAAWMLVAGILSLGLVARRRRAAA